MRDEDLREREGEAVDWGEQAAILPGSNQRVTVIWWMAALKRVVDGSPDFPVKAGRNAANDRGGLDQGAASSRLGRSSIF